jgi:hypothetical protein
LTQAEALNGESVPDARCCRQRINSHIGSGLFIPAAYSERGIA